MCVVILEDADKSVIPRSQIAIENLIAGWPGDIFSEHYFQTNGGKACSLVLAGLPLVLSDDLITEVFAIR